MIGHQDAAAQLGVPVGTVSARVSRARTVLLARLRDRGLTPAGAAAVACAAAPASAGVPQALLLLVRRQLADGFASAPDTVLGLAASAAGGMPMTGKWLGAAVLIAGTLLATAGGVWLADARPPATAPDGPGPAGKRQPTLPALGKQPDAAPVDRQGDPLPAGALFRFGSLRGRHDDTIRASALAPDGKILATSTGQSVVLWDLATSKPLRRFDTSSYWTFARPTLVFSPDGRRLGYIQADSFGCVWDVHSGKEVARFERKDRGDAHYRALGHFTPDSKQFVVGEGRTKLVFWDLEQNRAKRVVRAEQVSPLSPDARTGVRFEPPNFPLVFLDTRTGKPTGRLDAVSVTAGMDGVAFAPDGKSLAVVDRRKEIQVRDYPGGGLRCAFPLPDSARYKVGNGTYWEYKVRFAADGKTLLLTTYGGVVHRWDLATRRELPPLKGHVGMVTGAHLLPDQKTAITTGVDGLIRRWDARTGRELARPDGYAGAVHADYSPDGRFAAVGDQQGRLELWDVRRGGRPRVLQAGGPAVTHLTFTRDGKALAAAREDGRVHFWSVPDGKAQRVLHCGKRQRLTFTRAMQFSPDGRSLLLSDADVRACVWDLASGEVRWEARLAHCAFSADGTAVIGELENWHVLDASTGKPHGKLPQLARLRRLDRPKFGGVQALACSPDGQRVAVGHQDGTVSLCLTTTAIGGVCHFRGADELKALNDPFMRVIGRLKWGNAPVYALAFSPDSRWLCSSGADGSVRLWEVATRGEVLRLPGHVAAIGSGGGGIAFGADGRTVLSWGGDAQAYLWSLRPPAAASEKSNLEKLWASLAGEPKTAYRALWRLSDARGSAAFLRGKIPPVKPVAAERLQRLIADLDSDKFAVRQAASQALDELGHLAVPAVRKALAGNPPLEQRRRLEAFSDRVETRALTAGELRTQRAITALELRGTPEARRVLMGLAAGAPGALPTREAKAALRRLGR